MENNTFVWSASDAKNGWCRPDQVGQPATENTPAVVGARPEPGEVPAAPADPAEFTAEPEALQLTSNAAAVARERGIAATDAEGLALIMLELDPEGFGRRNPTIYMDLMRSQRAERQASALQAQQLADLASGKIKALSTRQIVDKMVQALFAEGPEAQARILERWDISADDLAELGEAAAQGDAALDAQLGLPPLVSMEAPTRPVEAPEPLGEADPAVVDAEPVQGHRKRQVPERWEPPAQPERPTLAAWMQSQDR
jgi:hypothetical protein